MDDLKTNVAKPSAPPRQALPRTTKLPAPQAKPVAPPVRPLLFGEERRRSQRVLLRVRANVHVVLQGKEAMFEVTTLSVNDHGALIVMERTLPLESRLVLENCGTKQRVTCKVTRPPREMPEGYHIPLEFDSPAPDFWKIAFPPTDWRPEDQ